ncbi:MAG TPA: hypothetical protein VFC79_05460 [Tissierellaceae bacterium]|nr:hypothetical protein [Tissierellaceae bacterium]
MTENKIDSKEKFDSKSSAENDLGLQVLNREHEEIVDWLEKVEFNKQFIGGVDEQDVWKKIHELNKMYEAALRAERIRYDALLEQQKGKHESKPDIDGLRKKSSSYE